MLVCFRPTCVFNVLSEIKGAVGLYGGVEGHSVIKGGGVKKPCAVCFDWPSHTFLTQISHEQLQADEGKNRESEDGQNHDVYHLLH